MSDESKKDDSKVSSRRRMLLAGTALAGLSAQAPVRTREGEQEKARARWSVREARLTRTPR